MIKHEIAKTISEKSISVIEMEDSDLLWNLGYDNDGSTPKIKVSSGSYARTVSVDPFPCYSANVELVSKLLLECIEAYPIDTTINYFILNRERIDRSNGTTYDDSDSSRQKLVKCGCSETCTDERKKQCPTFGVVISGKRIPIHPAMLRYLIGHEYGHCVQSWMEWELGLNDEGLLVEYSKLRGIPTGDSDTRWDQKLSEIFANDFRVAVLKREEEFWPHNGVEIPDWKTRCWWKERTVWAPKVKKPEVKKV
jgi:hypothetical protein